MNTVDILLSLDNEKLELISEAELEIPRLTRKAEQDFKVKLHGIPARRFTKLVSGITDKSGQVQTDKAYDANISICLAGMVEPSMKDKSLLEKFNCSTPGELLEKIFTPSEIGMIADKITELSGFGGGDVVDEVKN